MLNRFYFTTSLYGLRHGILSLPRILVSNLVNFFAVWRALRLYMGHRLFGKNLVWDKTPHTYPASKLVKPAKRGKVCPGANSTS
jgi:adsorption protein B